MRLQSLSWLLATAVFITACGSGSPDNVTPSSGGQFSSLPTITPETPNPVSIAEGEILNGFAVVDDEKNDRWLVADTIQGIIAVDKTTDERTILIPLASDSNDSILYSVKDIALDSNGSTLYIIDDEGAPNASASTETPGNLISVDLNTDDATVAMAFDDMAAENGYKSREPNALFFDEKNNRLLIGDARGLTYNIVDSNGTLTVRAFAVFTFDATSETPLGVLAAEANAASPMAPTLDVREFHFDADNDVLYVSLFNQIGSTSAGQFILQARSISIETWEQETLYSENPANISNTNSSELSARGGIRNSLFTSITLNNATNNLYVYNPFVRTVLEFKLNDITDTAFGIADANRLENSNTEERSLRSASQLTIDETGTLEVFDSELRGFFTVDIESNKANLIFAGTPIPESPLDAPQRARALAFSDNALIVSDDSTSQLNLLKRQDDEYEVFILEASLETPDTQESIVGTSTTLAEGVTSSAPLSPKPLFLAKNRQGDTFFFAEGFQQKTDNEQEINLFPEGIYRMRSGDNSAYPTITINNDGAIRLLDINTFYAPIYSALFGTSRSFSSGSLIDFAASSEVVYMAESNFLFGWNEKEELFVQLAPTSETIQPSNIVGIAVDEDNDRVLIMDANLDALIAISENLNDDNRRTVEFISSADKAPFTPIPSGLALDADNNLAYTFENTLRAVIQIDIETGDRKRIDSNPNFIRSVSNLTISDDGQTLYLIERNSRRVISLDIATGEQAWLD